MQSNLRTWIARLAVSVAVSGLLFANLTPIAAATTYTPAQVRAFVNREAIKQGIDPVLALFIVQRESQFDSTKEGDDGQSRGLWQISRVWHPEVSDKCAFDVVCSTAWSLKHIKAGYVREWSTYRFCKKWYAKACPFP